MILPCLFVRLVGLYLCFACSVGRMIQQSFIDMENMFELLDEDEEVSMGTSTIIITIPTPVT